MSIKEFFNLDWEYIPSPLKIVVEWEVLEIPLCSDKWERKSLDGIFDFEGRAIIFLRKLKSKEKKDKGEKKSKVELFSIGNTNIGEIGGVPIFILKKIGLDSFVSTFEIYRRMLTQKGKGLIVRWSKVKEHEELIKKVLKQEGEWEIFIY